jgi:hemoglobin-like flavoprotein
MPGIATIAPPRAAWTLSTDDVRLIRASFERARPVFHVAPDLFYERLFYLAPSLRRLFPEDMHALKRRFVEALMMVVRGIGQPEMLIALLRHLGQRLDRRGVTAAHYQRTGDAFFWTLERVFADGFTRDVEIAWTRGYDQLTLVMLDAAGGVGASMRAA